MSVTLDILESWRRPRVVMRRKLAEGLAEGRSLAMLMGACALIFVAQWPRLAREAHLDPSVPLEGRLGATLFALIFVAPLMFYVGAALSQGVARLLGGRGQGAAMRLALFWALLAVSPAMLLHGLLSGFLGPVPGVAVVGAGVALAFVYIWGANMIEAQRWM